jgi:LacI family transcriptional regulator
MYSTVEARPNVALIVETSVVYGRQILHGVARYLRAYGTWSIFLDERELLAAPPEWLLEWDGDGVICRSTTPSFAQALRERRLAVVDLNDRYGELGFPHISSDMRAIGRMAAEHLLERGFRHLAYCGFSNEPWSAERLAGVEAALYGRGKLCGSFSSPWSGLREHRWQDERDRIAGWLSHLPRPLGLVACNDVRGQHILDACRVLGLAVPEEVAVVGVDNSETFCELCDPPLSSVLPNAERIGFEAAALLSRLMAGDPPPEHALKIPPKEVIVRQSSDVLAVEDPVTAAALRYIREHAHEGIDISDVVLHAAVSRSTLERRFRQFLGHSPQAELRHVRLKRVKQLLLDTDWPLERIAEAAGFTHPEYMMVQFKRVVGQTPSRWRQGHAGGF